MIPICCCLRLKDEYISKLSQRRGFNGSTGVIGMLFRIYSYRHQVAIAFVKHKILFFPLSEVNSPILRPKAGVQI